MLDAAIADDSWTVRCGGLDNGANLGDRILHLLHEYQPRVIRRMDGRDCGDHGQCLTELLEEWSGRWGVASRRLVVWPVCPELARALACGHLRCDVSVLWQREVANAQDRAPMDISSRCLRSLMKWPVAPVPAIPEGDFSIAVAADAMFHVKRRRGSISYFPFGTILACMRAGSHMKVQANFKQACQDSIVAGGVLLGRPEVVAAAMELANVESPSKDTLCRARLRFDIANMFAMRSLYKQQGPCFPICVF